MVYILWKISANNILVLHKLLNLVLWWTWQSISFSTKTWISTILTNWLFTSKQWFVICYSATVFCDWYVTFCYNSIFSLPCSLQIILNPMNTQSHHFNDSDNHTPKTLMFHNNLHTCRKFENKSLYINFKKQNTYTLKLLYDWALS